MDSNSSPIQITAASGQLTLERCPECGAALEYVREGSDEYEECTQCDYIKGYPADIERAIERAVAELDVAELDVDPAAREAESNFRLSSYFRNEASSLAKWAAGQLDAHPYADLLPMMTPDEGLRLRASIEETGYDKEAAPIILYGGRILDGRNRSAAAHDIWLRHKDDPDAERYQPSFREFQGGDLAALGYVKRHGLDRRQLEPSQAALVGSELHDRLVELRAKAKAKKGANTDKRYARDDDEWGWDDDDAFGDVKALGGRSAAHIAGMVGASERSIERMNRIRSKKTGQLVGEQRQREIIEAIRNNTMTAREAEAEIAAAALAERAAKAKAEAEAAAERVAAALASPTAGPDQGEVRPWPGRTLDAAHGRRVQQADALELLDAVDPHTAATIVLDPPPFAKEDFHAHDDLSRLLTKCGRALAPGGDVWLVGELELLGFGLLDRDPEDDGYPGWVRRAMLAWTDTGPLGEPWAARPKIAVWLTRAGDRTGRDIKEATRILGDGPLLELGNVPAAEYQYLKHPQQRPEVLYDGLLAIGTGLVVVPYCGTGAAAVAAVKRGRPVIAGDLVAEYLEAAVKRMAAAVEATAKKATAKPEAAKKKTPPKPEAKKTTAKKKAPPKPEAAKKTTAKKTTAKKTTAKKTTAKKKAK